MHFAVGAQLSLPVCRSGEHLGDDVDRVDPNLNVPAVAKIGRENTNDSDRLTVQNHVLTHNVGVAAEMALPKAISQQSDTRGAKLSLGFYECAPQNRLNSKYGENVWRSHHSGDALGLTSSGKVETQAPQRGRF